VDFISFAMAQAFDHLRNLLHREAPSRERVERAAPPIPRREAGMSFPDSFESVPQALFLGIGLPLRERRFDRLPREAARGELALDPTGAVTLPAQAHRRSRRTELVEPSLLFEPREGARDGGRIEAAVPERTGELRAAAGPDRQEP
jgi:hypothetical protein